MEHELFSLEIQALVDIRNSKQRKRILTGIDEIEGDDKIKSVELRMKYLERVDKSFGTKHHSVEAGPKDTIVSPEEKQEVNSLLEESKKRAEEASNEPS